ncbi:hypothetical protein AB0D12_35665 [Streptomyces sp. NPDC048479]|uniref:hypothetical protein n=1 Tax=Streptomyces sp. NPDC048479 TaxID=3154725 RepID=UPI003421545F
MAEKETKRPGVEESGAARLREELSGCRSSQLEVLAEKAGDKLQDITGQFTDVAVNGGSLFKVGSRILGAKPREGVRVREGQRPQGERRGQDQGAFGGGKGKSSEDSAALPRGFTMFR